MADILLRNSLRKNFSWNLMGTLIYAATQWALIVVITRFGSVEMVGLFSLGLALTGPIILFTNLQLRTIQATTHNTLFKIEDYFGVRVLTNVAFIVFLLLLLILSDYDSYTNTIILLVGVTKLVESLSELLYGFFQQQERMEMIAKSVIARGISSLLVVILLISFTGSLTISLIGMSLSWLLVFLFYDLRNLKNFSVKLKPKFSYKSFDIIKVSLPLGLVILIVSLNTNLPKILIENMLSAEALGYFAAISYLVYIGSKFISSVGNALLPRLSLLYDNRNLKDFKKYLLILITISSLIGIILLLGALIMGDTLLYLIYGPEFYGYKDLFILIMIYGLFNYISYSLMVGLNAIRKFRIQPYLGFLWLLISILALLFFIPQFGLLGAAIALIVYSLSRILTIASLIFFYLKKVN